MNAGFFVFGHEAKRFAGHVHVVADVGLLIGRNALVVAISLDVAFKIANQFAQGSHGGRPQLFGAQIVGELGARIAAHDRVLVHVRVDDRDGLFGSRDEVLNIVRADRMIQRIRRGHRADQNQHDQSHALLPVVRSVEEADAGAGEHQQQRGWATAEVCCLWAPVERWVLDQRLRPAGTEAPRSRSPRAAKSAAP